jgi:hypothetical protein
MVLNFDQIDIQDGEINRGIECPAGRNLDILKNQSFKLL